MEERKKGIVMETDGGNTLIVLTPQGEFIKTPWTLKDLPEIGSEVEFSQTADKKKNFYSRRFLALAASLILFFASIPFWSGIFLPEPVQTVAYVSIDINPSIELGLDGHNMVVEAIGLNADGDKILQKISIAGRNVQEAVEMITDEAVQEQYITSAKKNTVFITVSGQEKNTPKVEELQQQVKKVLDKHQITGEANELQVPLEVRTKAKELGLSAGKYVILMEAKKEGLDLSVDDVKDKSISKAIKDAGGVPGRIISKAQHDKNNLKRMNKQYTKELQKKADELKKKADELKKKQIINELKEKKDNKDSKDNKNNKDNKNSKNNADNKDSRKKNKDKDDKDNKDNRNNSHRDLSKRRDRG